MNEFLSRHVEYAQLSGIPATGISAGITLRSGDPTTPTGSSFGAAAVTTPRDALLAQRRFAAALGRSYAGWRSLSQVHGTRVVYRGEDEEPSTDPVADAHFTDQSELTLTIRVADCCPVIVCSADGALVGIAHAGWRGTVGGVVPELVHAMARWGNYESLQEFVAWIGPCAEVERYVVGGDVAERCAAWPEALRAIPHHRDRFHLDLRTILRHQLAEVGLSERSITVSCGGTIGDRRYHSYRRDGGRSGRAIAFVFRR